MRTDGERKAPRRLPFPRWAREVTLIGVVYAFYEVTRGLQHGDAAVAARNGWAILRWEQAWDIDPEYLLTHALVSVTPLAVAFAYFYSTMHYVVTPVVLVWMYRCHRAQYRTARTALAVSTLSGLLIFWALPTAPPRLLAGAGVPDALFDVRNWGWWGGEGSVPRGLGSITNQFAAMPSLHVGWALWCGVLVFRYASRGWLRALGLAYPLVTALVVLSTGNHYLLDTVAGLVIMAIGAVVALALRSASRRLRAHLTAAARPRPVPVAHVPATEVGRIGTEGHPVVRAAADVATTGRSRQPVGTRILDEDEWLEHGDPGPRREACLRR